MVSWSICYPLYLQTVSLADPRLRPSLAPSLVEKGAQEKAIQEKTINAKNMDTATATKKLGVTKTQGEIDILEIYVEKSRAIGLG